MRCAPNTANTCGALQFQNCNSLCRVYGDTALLIVRSPSSGVLSSIILPCPKNPGLDNLGNSVEENGLIFNNLGFRILSESIFQLILIIFP
jgi:hypothetical protein